MRTNAISSRTQIRNKDKDSLIQSQQISDFVERLSSLSSEMRFYSIQSLPHHLANAGQNKQLHSTLTNLNFMQTKIILLETQSLIEDYNLIISSDLDANPEQTQSSENSSKIIQDTLQLAMHILSADETQLAAQLLGRLLSCELPDIQQLLEQAKHWKGSHWFRPLTASMSYPGGLLIRTLTGHAASVTAVAVTPDGRRIVSGSADATLKIWNLATGEEVRTLSGHTASVTAVAVMPDGRCVISGSYDKTLKVWDLKTGIVVSNLEGHREEIVDLAVMPDGHHVISIPYPRGHPSGDGPVVWDLESARASFLDDAFHDWGYTAVMVTTNGKQAIYASRLEPIRVVDIDTGKLLQILQGHTGTITALKAIPDSKHIISASKDGTLKVWNLVVESELLGELPGHRSAIDEIIATPDGQCIIAISSNEIRGWNLGRLRELFVINKSLEAITVTSDRRRVIAITSDELIFWDLQSGIKLFALGIPFLSEKIPFLLSFDHISRMIVTDDGRYLFFGLNEYNYISENLVVWDLEYPNELYFLGGHSTPIWTVAGIPNSQRAISASGEGILKVWDLEKREELFTLDGHTDGILLVKITPDGQRAISTSRDLTMRIWDLKNKKELHILRGHTDWVEALAITSDGRWAISASHDCTIKVWDLETGMEFLTLNGHEGPVYAVAMMRDERYMISVSGDHTLRLWDLEAGSTIANFIAESPLISCAISASGVIVAGTSLGQLHFLRLEGI